MGDSSGEDNDPPRGAGGGKVGGKKYLAFPSSPLKGQSSVKSVNNSVINPTTVEETFADVSSFIKELGSESECDNALKEAAKLLRGKNLRYGNAPNSEQMIILTILLCVKDFALVVVENNIYKLR